MTPQRIVELFSNLVLDACERAEETRDEPVDELIHNIVETVDFKDAGMMCGNPGFTLRMDDGSEFQIQIVRSK